VLKAAERCVLISICIPSIRPDTLVHAIASVLRQGHDAWELIVVGQGNELLLRSAVAQAASGDTRVRYIHLERLGTCAARNRGIQEARGDVIAFMDDDCEASDDWLLQIVAAFDRFPGAGIVAGALVAPPPGPGRFRVCPEMIPLEILYDPATDSEAPEGFGAAGANLALRPRVVETVGPFDELLGPGTRFASTEDTDYIIRAEAARTCIYSTPAVVMHHTYGIRYGIRAAYRLQRNYAVGNGALAAKLTLVGDPRGRLWLRNEVRAALVEPIKSLRPHLLPRRLLRLGYYALAYRTCWRTCSVSSRHLASAVLQPVARKAR
jgi:glycosyltransferase involved in cell wall biosynthesis